MTTYQQVPLKEGVMSVGLSDDQLNYWAKKISSMKTVGVHKNIKFLSLTNYAVKAHKNALTLKL